MPGLTVLCDVGDARMGERVREPMRRAAAVGQYDVAFSRPSPRVTVAETGYESYPFARFSHGPYHFFLEGHFYETEPGQYPGLMEELAAALDLAGEQRLARIAEWQARREGGFLLVAVHEPTGNIFVMNDRFGRLPAYWIRTEEGIACGRRLRPIIALNPDLRFDPKALAVFLRLGYPLGTRTLIQGVRALEPGSVLIICGSENTVKTHPLQKMEFGRYDPGPGSMQDAAKKLKEHLLRSVEIRAGRAPACLISLSGGLDSRAVAAALSEVRPDATAVTYLDASGLAAFDAECAQQVARALGLPWALYALKEPTTAEAADVLFQKQALCNLTIAFMLPFYRALRDDYGPTAHCFTGDLGDKVLPCLEPARPLHDIEQAVDYVLNKNSIWPTDAVCAFTGITDEDLRNEVRERLDAYPEPRLEHKIIHFMIRERAMRMVFESEDRNRCHMASLTPYFDQPFFNAAMAIPAKWKRHHVFYRVFLNTLSRTATDVPYANWRISINQRLRLRAMHMLNHLTDRCLSPGLKKRLKDWYRHTPAGFGHRDHIMNAVAYCCELSCDAPGSDLNWDAVRRAVPENADQAYYLLSAAALDALLRGDRHGLLQMGRVSLP